MTTLTHPEAKLDDMPAKGGSIVSTFNPTSRLIEILYPIAIRHENPAVVDWGSLNGHTGQVVDLLKRVNGGLTSVCDGIIGMTPIGSDGKFGLGERLAETARLLPESLDFAFFRAKPDSSELTHIFGNRGAKRLALFDTEVGAFQRYGGLIGRLRARGREITSLICVFGEGDKGLKRGAVERQLLAHRVNVVYLEDSNGFGNEVIKKISANGLRVAAHK